ncbi:hypothetical protein T484DRAFT_1765117 [Baffinella frigidus]|nr:hypothetical protein T484DRAFT_1765117 [Cryptophyta sp. CCMP2293]
MAKIEIRALEKMMITYDTNLTGELSIDEFEPMMADLLSTSLKFDGLETWDQVAVNETQMRLLFSHDWMQQEEAYHRLQTKMVREGEKQQLVDKIGVEIQKSRQTMHDKALEADSLSKSVLRNRLLFLADQLINKGIISVPQLSWDGSGGEKEDLARLHVGFLFKNYEVTKWQFEILEMWRKLLTTSVLVFFYKGSILQLAGGFFLMFFFLDSILQPEASSSCSSSW